MGLSWNLLVVALAACGSGDEQITSAAPSAPSAPQRAPERPPPGAPHGGNVLQVAVTEQGDAAVTADNLDALRLWPSLDGKRQPVALAAAAPAQLAIAHAGDDLLVAVLDEAHGAHLLRVGRDGNVRARIQLPELGYAQLVAIDGGVLARRVDQSIDRFDATGVSRGRIVAEPGQRVAAIAVRNGSAIALIGEGETSSLRWIVLGTGLDWGTPIALPEPAEPGTLALAPDHQRVAVVAAKAHDLEVYDLQPLAHRHMGNTIGIVGTTAFGFIDRDHVAISGTTTRWWTATGADPDPWGATTPPSAPADAFGIGLATADGMAVSAFGPGLALTDLKHLRYLGWKELGLGSVSVAGDLLSFASSTTKLRWLDANLETLRTVELHDPSDKMEAVAGFAAGDHHAIVERRDDGKVRVELVDSTHKGLATVIGTYATVDRIELDPATEQLAIVSAGTIERFQLDLAHDRATPLGALAAPTQIIALRLLDPARAFGAIAAVAAYGQDGQQELLVYRAPAKPGSGKLAPAVTMPLAAVPLGIDATGAAYAIVAPPAIAVYRDGREVSRFAVDPMTSGAAVSADGAWLAVLGANSVSLVDAQGGERWHASVWAPVAVTLTADARRVVVRTSGGLIALDTATGARAAMSCGWEFGLHDQPIAQTSFGVPVVCEDSSRD